MHSQQQSVFYLDKREHLTVCKHHTIYDIQDRVYNHVCVCVCLQLWASVVPAQWKGNDISVRVKLSICIDSYSTAYSSLLQILSILTALVKILSNKQPFLEWYRETTSVNNLL